MRPLFVSTQCLVVVAAIMIPLVGFAEVSIEQINVGTDKWFPKATTASPASFESIQIEKNTRFLHFSVKSDSETLRWRYQLEGVDTEWKDAKLESALTITLYNADGLPIFGKGFPLKDQALGWDGSLETSEYTAGRGELEVPTPSDEVQISIALLPSEKTCGMLGIDNLFMIILRANRTSPEVIRLTSKKIFDGGYPAPHIDWFRAGSKPEMAKLRTRNTPFPHPVLAIIDDTPDYFASWNCRLKNLSLQRGDKIRLVWNAAYSFGSSSSNRITYREKLPLGKYKFRVAEALPNGELTGKETRVDLEIVLPWYLTPLYWFGIASVIFIGLTLIIRHYMQIRMERRLAASEKQRLVEEERTRIARDIHDDLGATLTQIAMLSEMARVQVSDDTVHSSQLENIFKRAHSATRKLDEIVWAINPSNDTTEHLAGYLCQFAEDYLKLANLEFRLDAPDTLPHGTLTAGQRHHLFLVAKESLHNIVKHAAASEVWLRIHVRDNMLIIQIEDNGCGFQQTDMIDSAHGSANMRTRMTQIGGSYERESQPGRGTTVILSIPI